MSTDFREFLIILRRALQMIVRWIEKKCELGACQKEYGEFDEHFKKHDSVL